jgi:hypothetical protein
LRQSPVAVAEVMNSARTSRVENRGVLRDGATMLFCGMEIGRILLEGNSSIVQKSRILLRRDTDSDD